MIHEDTDNGSSNDELPAIVVYMIDPFQVSGVSEAKDPLWSLNGLIRAFAEMTSMFPDALKNNVFLQVRIHHSICFYVMGKMGERVSYWRDSKREFRCLHIP